MASKRDGWNICDDFLDPLAHVLIDYKRVATSPRKAIAPYCRAVAACKLTLARAWLQVNVSADLAEYVMKRVADVETIVMANAPRDSWPHTLREAGEYFASLSQVLREREGGTLIPRPKETIPPDKLSPHYTPAELADVFDRSWDTVRKMLKTSIPHVRHSTKDYQIHVDYLPKKRG